MVRRGVAQEPAAHLLFFGETILPEVPMRPLLALLLCSACGRDSFDTGKGGITPDSDPPSSDDSTAHSAPPPDSATESHPPDSPPPDSPAESVPPTDTADTADTAEPAPSTAAECFADIFGDGTEVPDYDKYGPVLNSTCTGTNHQDIEGIERVVFIGDSITVGSPPTDPANFYRVQLADWLVETYGLEAPDALWEWYDVFEGTTIEMESGDFASCAKWGARTDDLIQDNDQVVDCLAEDKRDLTTLVVMTIGGNDLFNLAEEVNTGTLTTDELWALVTDYMGLVREAVTWMTEDPERFPNGVYVVFANLYEFTDALGNVDACPGAAEVGYDWDIGGDEITEMMNYSQEEFMSIAVDTNTDMLFMGEAFCGHGYNADEPTSRCYRGPDSELWFDLTCFHPNDTGHVALGQLFRSVIEE